MAVNANSATAVLVAKLKVYHLMNSSPRKCSSMAHDYGRCTPRWMQTKESSYLVDPASCHMLVSKIKPCMSKYKQIYTVKLRMAH